MLVQKKWFARILFLVVMLAFCGCSGKNGSVEEQASENIVEETTTEYVLLNETEVTWKDNTLDDMYAVFNLPAKRIEVEGEQAGAGTACSLVCEGGCVLFRNHLLGYGKDWSGVNGITQAGQEFSFRIEVDENPKENRVDRIGPVSGKNGYVAYNLLYDGRGTIYFYELNKEFQKISSVQMMLESDRELSGIMGDAEGNFHFVYSLSNGKNKYVIVSSDGEVIFQAEGKHMLSLNAFGGGRVAVCDQERSSNGLGEKRFYEADLKSGELCELSVSKKLSDEQKNKDLGQYAVPVDEDRILWCTYSELLLYDSNEGSIQTLYRWSNHGIVPTAFDGLAMLTDGAIGILYRDADGSNYMLLNQTTEREAINAITFAVSPSHENKFSAAAAYFNKNFPAYNVSIRTDWDETSLLTQLGAGSGPVIVDTALTGFEDLVSLWQPLDGFLEQTGLTEEMIPEALSFGKIGDNTYGIVRDFMVRTLVISGSGPSDWNYDGFLDALEKSGAAPIAHWYGEAVVDRRQDYFDLLKNGIWDNYYFDVNTGEMIFGTQKFSRVLKLSERAIKTPPAEGGQAIKEGTVLCEIVDVYGIQDALSLRRRLEANGEKIIGYPTTDGARNLLIAGDPIVIRSTATEEEKQIAYTFLKFVLAREAYASISTSNLPVRKDALEDKFENYEHTLSVLSNSGSKTKDMPELDRNEDVPFLNSLIQNGTVQRSFPIGLQKVFDEEFGDYLAGRIDGKALDEHLKSRVWLYLAESK